jgi:hypothetical protein
VRRGQPGAHLPADPQRQLRRGDRLAPQPLVERLAVEERHHHVRPAAVLADVQDRDDVVVVELGGGAGLAQEPLAVDSAGGERRLERLDRDLAAEPRVLGEVHRAHPALAELAEHEVLADPRRERVGAGVRAGRGPAPGDRLVGRRGRVGAGARGFVHGSSSAAAAGGIRLPNY